MSPSDIPWTTLRALSFDVYGTLIDWNKGRLDSLYSTPLARFLSTDRDQVVEEFARLEPEAEKTHPKMLKREIQAMIMKDYIRAKGLDGPGKLSPEEIEESARIYGEGIGDYPAFPDTIDAIRRLAQHFLLIPLSNIDRQSFSRTLSHALHHPPFATHYIAEDIQAYKPSPRVFAYLFAHARQDFGIERNQIVHFAQSVSHDVAPTRDLGIPCVWVDRQGSVEASGRSEEEWKEEYGFALRVMDLKSLADVVDEAFEKEKRK